MNVRRSIDRLGFRLMVWARGGRKEWRCDAENDGAINCGWTGDYTQDRCTECGAVGSFPGEFEAVCPLCETEEYVHDACPQCGATAVPYEPSSVNRDTEKESQ